MNQDGSWNPVPKDLEAERLKKEKEAEERKNQVSCIATADIVIIILTSLTSSSPPGDGRSV